MSAASILAGIRDGDYHQGGIRCLRLLRLRHAAFADLRGEVAELIRSREPSSAGRPRHPTAWVGPSGEVLQYSLLNASGRADDTSGDHNESCLGKRFHDAVSFPALGRLVQALPHCINFRVNLLGPGASLGAHEEHVTLRLRSGRIGLRGRFHLPVTTNPLAELSLDGDVYHLEEGVVHFVNNGCVHSAANGGDARRVHLVWDMLLTREACECMFGELAEPEPWLARVPRGEREPAPVRSVAMPPARRLPRPVPWREARSATFSTVQ